MDDILLYRRHSVDCPQAHHGRDLGRNNKRRNDCTCPVWRDARTVEGIGKDFSMKTRDWERAERRARAETDPGAPTSKKHLSEAIESYIETGRINGWVNETIVSNRNTLNALLAFCTGNGWKLCEDLTLDRLNQFRGSRKARDGKSPMKRSTMIKEMEYLRAFGRYCVDNDWMKRNVAKQMKAPKEDEARGKKKAFDSDEIKAIVAACDRITNHNEASAARGRLRTRAAVLVMLYTGLRISDVAVLKRADVSFKTGRFSVHTIKSRGHAEAYGVLPQVVLDALAALPHESKVYFFWSGNGKRSSIIGSLRRSMDCAFRLAGLKPLDNEETVEEEKRAHLHKFRRTFATKLRDDGAPIQVVQKKLGHKRITTTQVYLGDTEAERRQVESVGVTYDLDGVGSEVGGQDVVRNPKRNVKSL